MSDTSVRVAVRVRPFNQREKDRGATLIIGMNDDTTSITNPEDPNDKKNFRFDFSYWSHDGFLTRADGYTYTDGSSPYADQNKVFQDLGQDVLNNAFKGFNCSLFAYGQTGSGKSYSMVGYGANKGIIPITCEELFHKMQAGDPTVEYRVTVSMLEIYNERIRDLLNPDNNPSGGLKVREKPKVGVYVDGLHNMAVSSYKEVDQAMEAGTRNRTVASTNMNATSSRAHTVFTVVFTQIKTNDAKQKSEVVSKINLIDLAGSERAESTGATGDRLKEGSAINQSLSALGNVISALAEQAQGKKGVFIPYRNSVLTRLLQESLGGNAKTIMIAAVSPAGINFDESLSTLRYADRAKKIKNKAIVNENPTDKLIRELKEENERLKRMAGGNAPTDAAGEEEMRRLKEELEHNEKMMADMKRSWEEKLKESTQIMAASEVRIDKTEPHLVNLNEDPMMSECLLYYIQEGPNGIGRKDADQPQEIILSGLSINKEHAIIMRNDRVCTLSPIGNSKVFVNGVQITGDTDLKQSSRIIFGNHHVFRFNDPVQAQREAAARGGEPPSVLDWEYAQKELLQAQGMGGGVGGLGAKQKELEDELKRKEAEFEEKIRALESQLTKAGEGGSGDYARKTAELERQMDKQRKEMEEYAQQQKRRKEQYASLEDSMTQLYPLVSEANDMAQTLDKKITYEPKLISSEDGSVELMVQCTKSVDEGQITLMWTHQKFRNRLFLMRDEFTNFLENGELSSHDRDPFDDPAEDRKIGTVYVYLEPLAYLLEVEANAVIMDYKGKSKGELRVEIRPTSADGISEPDFDVDDPEELLGQRLDFVMQISHARNIPVQYGWNTFCKYNFITSDLPFRTPMCPDHSTDPVFAYEKHFTINPVTQEHLDFLLNEALAVEVRGHTEMQAKQYTFKDKWKLAVSQKQGPSLSKLLEVAGIDLEDMKVSAKRQSIQAELERSGATGGVRQSNDTPRFKGKVPDDLKADLRKLASRMDRLLSQLDDESVPATDRLRAVKRELPSVRADLPV